MVFRGIGSDTREGFGKATHYRHIFSYSAIDTLHHIMRKVMQDGLSTPLRDRAAKL
jgi:hypothetical protein